jgi:hypothetical protein
MGASWRGEVEIRRHGKTHLDLPASQPATGDFIGKSDLVAVDFLNTVTQFPKLFDELCLPHD